MPGLSDGRRVYEVSFHVLPTVAEDEAIGVMDKIRAEIGRGNLPDSKTGVEIVSEQVPVKMMLAYTIERRVSGKREKYNETYFGFIKFAIEKEHIPALEQMLRTTKEILRYLLIETKREETTPRRAVFTSDRLEGETIKLPTRTPEASGSVSEEELDRSIEEALTQQ
jgi:ribosomal protein S6